MTTSNRILITGGAGFIGRHVIDALGLLNYFDVTVFDNFAPEVHGTLAPTPTTVTGFQSPERRVPVIVGDVRDPEALTAACQNIDTVIHLAAAVSVSASLDHPSRFIETNGLGTAHLTRAIRSTRVRHLVNASSMAVYGEGVKATGVTEDHPTRPLNVYALSKLHAEQLCLLLGQQTSLPVANLRFFNVYGPGQSLGNAETGVVAIWANLLLHHQPITVFEDGMQLRDFVYVTDLAMGVAQAVDQELNGTFNLGTGTPVPVLAVAQALASRLGEPTPVPTGVRRMGDSRHCWASILKAQLTFQYAVHTQLADGIDATLGWASHTLAVS